MLRRTVLVVVLLGLVASVAVAQDEPEEAPLRPCLLAGGRTYVPVAFVAGIPGLDAQETVVLDGVPMIPVAAAIKAVGGSAQITYEFVCPDQVKVPAVVVRANMREWQKQHCTYRTYRCCGPCGLVTSKVMTCPCMAPCGPNLVKPCTENRCPFRGKCRRLLVLQVGGQEMRFEAATPGSFWKHEAVRDLIAVYRRQPVPEWPYVDTTFPTRPPFGVNWKRPYLEWKPDESWLQAHMQPAAEEEAVLPPPAPKAARLPVASLRQAPRASQRPRDAEMWPPSYAKAPAIRRALVILLR